MKPETHKKLDTISYWFGWAAIAYCLFFFWSTPWENLWSALHAMRATLLPE